MSKAKRIGVIMSKSLARDKMVISLQRKGFKTYVIPQDEEMFDYIKRIDVSIIIIGEKSDDLKCHTHIESLKKHETMADIPIIVIVNKRFDNSSIVKMLQKGAMDVVYIKNNDIDPITDVIDKFFKSKGTKFKMDVKELRDYLLIKIQGELDISSSAILQKTFKDFLKRGKKSFIMDLGDINHLESVGLGALIYVQKSVKEIDGQVKYIIKSERIKKVFAMVKLDKYFEIFEDIKDVGALSELAEQKIKAVVIDDAKFMRRLIGGVLEAEDFEVYEFANPVEALAKVRGINPDIVIVDYEMPEMNGIEFIEKFDPAKSGIPTIMMTTIRDVDLVLKAIRVGASDFLNKPFEREELVHIMRKIIDANNMKKENEKLFLELKIREKELEHKNSKISGLYKEIEEELVMASEIQQRLLPQKFPDIEGMNFAVKYKPSQDIGGDFYDILEMSNGFYGIAFADVSGHGIPAALLTTMFKVYLMAYAYDIISPAESMELVNEVVANAFPEGKFISVFYLVIDSKTGKISYCKAAQEPGLYMKKDGSIEELVTDGTVLGLFSGEIFPELLNFEEDELELKSGEKIFLYTDGIVEAQNKKEEMYGLERLKALLIKNRDKNADELIDIAYEDLLDFLEGLPILDDLTLMAIEKE